VSYAVQIVTTTTNTTPWDRVPFVITKSMSCASTVAAHSLLDCIHPRLYRHSPGSLKSAGETVFSCGCRAKIVDTEAEARPGNQDHGAFSGPCTTLFTTEHCPPPRYQTRSHSLAGPGRRYDGQTSLPTLAPPNRWLARNMGIWQYAPTCLPSERHGTSCWWATEPVVVIMMAAAPSSPTELVPPP
jgi:hypothetical protein